MVELFIDWNVEPEIGIWRIRWYGLLFAAGFALGYQVLKRIFKKEGINEDWLDKVLIYMIVGTVVGARLGHCFFYGPYWDEFDDQGRMIVEGYLSHPYKILYIWEGGLASHGGAIGNIIALWIFSKRISKRSILWILDRVVISVALAASFIRLGNLMNSEIVGTRTDLPWGFIFRYNGENFARHPAQLYESIMYLSIFAILFTLYRKTDWSRIKGKIFGLFLMLVFTGRFLVEFVKQNQEAFEDSLPINMGQILSIPFVLIGLYFFFRFPKSTSENS